MKAYLEKKVVIDLEKNPVSVTIKKSDGLTREIDSNLLSSSRERSLSLEPETPSNGVLSEVEGTQGSKNNNSSLGISSLGSETSSNQVSEVKQIIVEQEIEESDNNVIKKTYLTFGEEKRYVKSFEVNNNTNTFNVNLEIANDEKKNFPSSEKMIFSIPEELPFSQLKNTLKRCIPYSEIEKEKSFFSRIF